MPAPPKSERRLIKAARQGEADAAGDLVRLHWAEAHRLAFLILRDEHLAEDIAQESLLKAIHNLGRFDHRRPMLPWVRRIVANQCIDRLRAAEARSARERIASTAPLAEVPAGLEDPELLSALWSLGPNDRAAVSLRHIFGFPIKEIAQVLGEPESTVRSRIHRSLIALRGRIDREEVSP